MHIVHNASPSKEAAHHPQVQAQVRENGAPAAGVFVRMIGTRDTVSRDVALQVDHQGCCCSEAGAGVGASVRL